MMNNEFFEQVMRGGSEGAAVQIIVSPELLHEFAMAIAVSTAKKIVSEVKAPDRPLTEKEVCVQLGKTRQTLSKYRRSGKLRYNRIGREIYYLPSQLNEDLQNF